MNLSTPDTQLHSYLEPGEQLLWSGSPRRGLRFRAQDAFLIPFSIVWCGFAIFWTYSASTHGAPVFFTLWGLMFVFFGLFFVFGRFVTDLKKRASTAYGITNQRVLILSGLLSKELRSLNLRAIPEITLSVHSDSSGTITFGTNALPTFVSFRGWPGYEKMMPPAFEFVDSPQEVHRLVLSQQKVPNQTP